MIGQLNPHRIATMGIGYTPISMAMHGFDLEIIQPQDLLSYSFVRKFGKAHKRAEEEIQEIAVLVKMLYNNDIFGTQVLRFKKQNRIVVSANLSDIMKKDCDIKIEVQRLLKNIN